MKRSFVVLILLLLIGGNLQAQVLKERAVTLMGSRFDISIVAKDAVTANKNIDIVVAEINRIEDLISDWKAGTEVDQINKNAGLKPVKVSAEVYQLIKRTLYFSEITTGAFDISYAAMDRVWKFDGSMKSMPTADEIKKSVAKVGYQNIELDSLASTVFLKLPGMKIGFGATGKGYAADKGRELMERMGVIAGIVNASGDMATWGNPPKTKAWKVGLTNPFNENKYIGVLSLKRDAVVTSGSYEKYVEFNGTRYAHIINPVTGYPATGLISVTVIGPSAETANGLSTSIMVLGKEKGLALIKSFPLYSCALVSDNGEVIKSSNFKARLKKKLN